MTDQEKQELKEKLAKWAGWHEEKYEITRGAFAPILLAPNEGLDEGHVGYIPEHTPDFPVSLDTCLEWLSVDGWILFTGEKGIHAIVSKGGMNYEAIANEPALAYCLAIEKLIDGGV